MIKIIAEEVKLQRELSELFGQLYENGYIDINSLFNHLDARSKGFVSKTDLKTFFSAFRTQLKASEIDLLFYRLDINKDNYVNFWEFKRIITAVPSFQGTKLSESPSKRSLVNESRGSLSLSDTARKATTKYEPADGLQYTQRSRLTVEEKSFGVFMQYIAESEELMEELRCSLADDVSFSPYRLFKLFSPDKKGVVSFVNFKENLQNLGVVGTMSELRFIVDNYFNNVKYVEFAKLFYPQDDYMYKRMLFNTAALEDNKRPLDDILNEQTLKAVSSLLSTILEREIKIEQLKKKLHDIPTFNKTEWFNRIDNSSKGWLERSDVIR